MANTGLVFGFSALVFASVHLSAQDFYGEAPSKDITFWKNMGQLRRLDGTVETGVKFYSDGTSPQLLEAISKIPEVV